jgi:hypothetical protein
MTPLSTTDPGFLNDVQDIVEANGEILVVVRYVYGAGGKDFVLLPNMAEFRKLVSSRRERDSIIVMKSFVKVLTGIVDDRFIERCRSLFTENDNWLLIGDDNYEYTANWDIPESLSELVEALHDRVGNEVVVVEEPDYISNECCLAAYVPDADGVVRPGAY